MRYELTIVESLIEKLLDPELNKEVKPVVLDFKSLESEIAIEISNIKQNFVNVVFKLKKDKQIERYIQQHQSALIRLSNLLIKQISPSQFKKYSQVQKINSITELYFYFYSELEKLLSYIENYFSKYFNQNEKIPTSYQIIGQLEFREKLKKIESYNTCLLLNIATHPIYEFVEQNKPISFQKLIYLKELIKEIQCSCSNCKEVREDCKLSCSLIYLNFNSYIYFTHLTKIIKSDLKKEEQLTKQIEKLSFHLKKLNQVQTKPNISFKVKQASIKQQVGNWILEEMAHLEKVYQLTLKFPKANIDDLIGQFKLSTGFSVAQMAYFLRILVDTGIILNKNHKEVITFFADHLQTKKTETISSDSLRSKYYNVEDTTKDFVREKVIELLNETQKGG